MKPSCYTASKTDHKAKWIALRRDTRINWTAHWPDLVFADIEEAMHLAQCFWRRDIGDVARADFVLVYGEPHEHLRGALVEAGAAIGMGKTVIVVGEHQDYGSWQFHPSVLRAKDLDEAIWMMLTLFKQEHNGPELTTPVRSGIYKPSRAPATVVDSLDDEIPF